MTETPVTKIVDEKTGKEVPMPAEGSLGMLALGDITVRPWRQRRIETGYEKNLLERIKKQEEVNKKRKEEAKKKREEKQNNERKES